MYKGGKNGSGIYQRLINLIPPHDVYIECFLGSGALMRNKKPARHNIGCDLDFEALKLCKFLLAKSNDDRSHSLLHINAISFLSSYDYTGDEFIYCDPPYHPETRSNAKIYTHETDAEFHEQLLQLLVTLPCNVMLSGYDHSLYRAMLDGWNCQSYLAPTRAGHVTEHVWMNYETPTILHDYNHLGKDFRERERIRRKIKRWTNKLENLPAQERLAILEKINQI